MQSKRDTLPEGTAPGVDLDRGSTVPSERVTISSLPKSMEAVTGRRPRVEGDLPVRSLESLLALWGELPVDAGDRAVTRAVVDAIASLLPDSLVGACLVPAQGGSQELIRASEVAEERGILAADPTRLFPSATYERVVTFESGGSTLHVAGEDPSCEDEQSQSGILLTRAAAVARRGLELARMQGRATEQLAEARSLNAHIVQAEKLASLGQIAAGVVHELNNPLTSIVAYTDYLILRAANRAGGADTDEIDRLRRISESAGRMLRFTRDLVSYARPSSETPVPCSAHMVIDQAIAFCEHVLAAASVTVQRRFAIDLPSVRGKPEQLAQIFVNLITNACHAMLRGGTLTVTTRLEGALVCIDLTDTGHGIHPDHVPQVFTPFFTTKTSGAGTGLGLAIVKSILDGHGGTIRASSDGRSGATFSITLPAESR
jgi:two-component system, NtrC family, sensor kinase